MQGSTITIAPNQFTMGSDVFRRKLGLALNQSSGKRAARCLFGPPNPTTSNDMLKKAEAKAAWSFGRKWNFDTTGKSQPATCLQSAAAPEARYEWTEVYDQDLMAKCDRHRFEVPIAPNARPVTLLYAPTIQAEEDMIASSTVESVAVQTESLVDSVEIRCPILESVSVQTEPPLKKMQVDQETQVEETSHSDLSSHQMISCSPNSQKSFSMIGCQETEIHPEDRLQPDETMSSVSVKKGKRLPMPLTIPTSPDHSFEEQFDLPTSPMEEVTSASGIFSSSPPDFDRRRTGIDVFTFPPVESPSGGFKCLRIRNGSPILPRSGNKKLKQRSITEYMQVKKVKLTCGKKM